MIWLPYGQKHITITNERFNEDTPLIETIRERVGLKPGKAFRGGVATFTGVKEFPNGVSWFDLLAFDYDLRLKVGNDHRATGMWYHGIPTLFEYNQFMTPSYYAAVTRLLCRPGDKQVRTVINATRPNFAYLRSLGIRFVISDEVYPADKSVASHSPPPGPQLVQTLKVGDKSIHLYELDRPNLGDYSPTQVSVMSTAQDTLTGSAPGV